MLETLFDSGIRWGNVEMGMGKRRNEMEVKNVWNEEKKIRGNEKRKQ